MDPALLHHASIGGFYNPLSVSVNIKDGSCWVADYRNNQIVHVNSSCTSETARLSGFYYPNDVSVNQSDGSCWIANTSSNQVVHVSANGIELSRTGGFYTPYAVSANPVDGTCWVADGSNHQAAKLLINGTEVVRIDGLYSPQGIAIYSGRQLEGEPTASASVTPNHADINETISFAGTGSDSDGSIVRYEWDFNGDGTYDWQSSTNGTTSHQYESEGIYTPVFRVVDDSEQFAIWYGEQVHIGRLRALPSANVVEGPAPLTVNFTASFFDPDNQRIMRYEWDFDGDGQYDYSSTSTGNISHTYTTPGTYAATLKVINEDLVSATAFVTITVLSAPPSVTASASPTTGAPPLSVTFGGSASDDGIVMFYEWDFDGDGTYDWASGTTATTVYQYQTAGSYQAQLRVTDNQNLNATSQVTINVNSPPTISVAAITPNRFNTAVAVDFSCTAADADGSVTLYQWDFDGNGTWDWSSEAGCAVQQSYTTAGERLAKVQVTDNLGATATQTVPVQVLPAGFPVASFSAVPTSGDIPLTVTFSGSASDDGNITNYEWSFGDEAGAGYFDDMESGSGTWTATGSWALDTTDSYSGSASWTDSPGSDYPNSSDTSLTSQVFDFTYAQSPLLTFWHHYDTVSYYDRCRLEISTNNGSTWSELIYYSGYQGSWRQERIDLSAYAKAASVMIRFRLTSDSSNTRDGWYIDDVTVSGIPLFSYQNAATGNTSHTYLKAGDYTATLRVTDNANNQDLLYIPITATPAGPTAKAEADHDTGIAPWTVNLTGNNSSDSNGTIVLYEWYKKKAELKTLNANGYPTSQLMIGTWNAENGSDIRNHQLGIEFSDPEAGAVYGGKSWFVAEDSDGQFDWNSAAIFNTSTYKYGYSYINLYSPIDQTVQVKFGSDDGARFWINSELVYSKTAIESVYIDRYSFNAQLHKGWNSILVAVSQSTSSYGLAYRLTNLNNDPLRLPYILSSATSGTPFWSSATSGNTSSAADDNGSYIMTLRVTDNDGYTDTDSVLLDSQHAPEVSIIKPTPASQVGYDVQFELNVADDGIIVLYEWDFNGDGSFEHISTSPYSGFTSYAKTGTFSPRVRVTDDDGLTGTATTSITVVNTPPAITAVSVSAEKGLVPFQVDFTVNATDPDGSIIQYRWDFTTDGEYDWSNPTSGDVSHTYTVAGSYTATLELTDNSGKKSYYTVELLAKSSDSPLVTVSVSPEPGYTGDAMRYSCTVNESSSDINKYEWDFDGDGTVDGIDLSSGTLISTTSQYNTTTLAAANLIDGAGGNGHVWDSISNPAYPIEHIFSFSGGQVRQIDRVALTLDSYQNVSYWVKDFEILVSETGTAPTDFTSIGTYSLKQQAGEQFFAFNSVACRYIMLRILNSQNSTYRAELGEFKVFPEGGMDNLLSVDGVFYHSFPTAGQYNSTVTVTNGLGRKDSDSVTTEILPQGAKQPVTWVADGNNHRVAQLLQDGNINLSISGFSVPYAIDVYQADGSVWVSDIGTDALYKLDEDGNILVHNTGYYEPYQVSVDQTTGSVWLADSYHHAVLRLNPDGTESLKLEGFNYPYSVESYDTDHSVWICDTNNHSIKHYDSSGALQQTLTGFSSPRDVDIDQQSCIIWVADRNNDRVIRLNADVPDWYDVNQSRVMKTHDDTGDNTGSFYGNSTLITSGKFNGGVEFDGSGDSVQIPHSASYRPTSAITLEVWFKAEDFTTGNQKIMSCTENGGWSLGTDGANLNFLIEINDTYYSTGIPYAGITTGEWHHLAGVYNGSQIILYLDGIQQSATDTPSSGTITYHASNYLQFGSEASSYYNPAGDYFRGAIDDVRIWNVARSTAEIQAAMNAVLAGNETGLVSYWQFNEPSGIFHTAVPGFDEPVFVKVNRANGNCWVSDYVHHHIVQISEDGQNILSRTTGYYYPHMIDVNHYDGTAWIADKDNNQISKLLPDGTEIIRESGFYDPTAVAIDFHDRDATNPPVISASVTPLSGAIPLTVSLNCSATDNGTIQRYDWDLNGDGSWDYSSASNGTTSHTFTESGVYTPICRVIDNENNIATQVFTVQAGGLQTFAKANITKGTAPLAVSFSAQTVSPVGFIVRYEWDFEGDGTFDWSSTGTAGVNHTYSSAGSYFPRLRVTNSLGDSSESSIPISVSSSRPVARISVSPTSGQVPLIVSLNNSNSTDSDGSIVWYQWDYNGDGVFDYSSQTQPNTSFRYTTPGTYYPTLRVTDNDGFTAEAQQEIVVTGVGPVAHAAASPTKGEAPLTVNFNGTGTVATGSIALYEWSFGDRSFLVDNMEAGTDSWIQSGTWAQITSDSNSSPHCWTDSPNGSYANNTDSALRSITLDLSEAVSPVLSFFHHYDFEADWDYGYVEVWNGGSTWQVLAEFTGDVATWQKSYVDLSDYAGSSQVAIRFHIVTDDSYTRDGWYVDDVVILDRNAYSWQSTTSGQLSRTYTQVGTYIATLRVTDSEGLTDTDTVTIEVNEPGAPVAVIQATPQAGATPLDVIFNASSSTDSDGQITQYEWDFGNEVIRVESAGYRDGNYCSFMVHDVAVGTNNRGFNFVVLDEVTLDVLDTKSFDTYYSVAEVNSMISFIHSIPEGKIVLVAVKDDASSQLTNAGHVALEELGARMNRDIGYHDSWALVGIKGATDRSLWEAHQVEYGGIAKVASGVYSYTTTSNVPLLYTYTDNGSMVVRLRVTDNSGKTDEATTVINVGKPTAKPAAYPAYGSAPLSVNFICNGQDDDGTIEYFKWDFDGNGTWDSTSQRSDTVAHTFSTPGVYQAVLQVIDNKGLTDSKSLTITVTSQDGDNIPNVLATVSRTSGEIPLDVTLSGYATDQNGTIALYEWDFDNDGTYDWSSTEHGQVSHTYTTTGIHTAVLRVTDNDGDQGITSVEINTRNINAPIVNAASNVQQGNTPLLVSFTATTQGDMPIVLYEWDFTGDGVYTWSSPDSAATSYQYSIPGKYDAHVRITDSQGGQSEDHIVIQADASSPLTVNKELEGFNPDQGQQFPISTSLSADATSVTIKIIGADGQLVKTIADHEARSRGVYRDMWDGTTNAGAGVESGVYFFIIECVVGGKTFLYDPTGNSGTMTTITPTYASVFNPIEDQLLTATFTLSSSAEITTYVSPFNGGAGNRVRTIHLRTPKKKGQHVIAWDGVMDDGTMAPLDQNYVMAVFAYALSQNAIIVEKQPGLSDVSTDPDFYNPDNPFDPQSALVRFTLSKDCDVSVSIYDANGYLVKRWTETSLSAGQQTIQWDGRNTEGKLMVDSYYRVVLVATDSSGNQSRTANALLELFY